MTLWLQDKIDFICMKCGKANYMDDYTYQYKKIFEIQDRGGKMFWHLHKLWRCKGMKKNITPEYISAVPKSNVPFPDKKYKIIYADPPWSYENKKVLGSYNSDGGAENHYSTMDLEDICNLPINSISEKDSVLFLWGTVPMLPEAFQVMERWGFKYKTCLFWHKTNHYNGWFRFR